MLKQRGQSMVEFVLCVPILMLLVFGMIFSGFIYADYLQYNNAARDVARDIAIRTADTRDELRSSINSQNSATLKRYIHPLTKLYGANFTVEPKDEGGNAVGSFTSDSAKTVTVRLEIRRQNADTVIPTFARGLFPEKLTDIEYTMRLEEDAVAGNSTANQT